MHPTTRFKFIKMTSHWLVKIQNIYNITFLFVKQDHDCLIGMKMVNPTQWFFVNAYWNDNVLLEQINSITLFLHRYVTYFEY